MAPAIPGPADGSAIACTVLNTRKGFVRVVVDNGPMSPPETCLGPVWVAKPDLKHRLPLAWRWRLLVVLTLGLVGCFARPLWALCGHAWHNDLYSHILLVPFISLYFAVAKYRVVALEPQPKFQLSLLLPGWAGLCLLRLSSLKIPFGDYLALATTSLLLLLLGTAVVLLGWRNVGQFAFPIGFSFFAVPLPDSAVRLIEGFLQRHSADVASALFTVSGTPLVRDETAFQLPGFFLEVRRNAAGYIPRWPCSLPASSPGTFSCAGHGPAQYWYSPWCRWRCSATAFVCL